MNQNVDRVYRSGNALVAPARVAWLLLPALIALAAADALAAPTGEDAPLTASEATRIHVGPWIDVCWTRPAH